MFDDHKTPTSRYWTAAVRSNLQTLADLLLYLPDTKSREELEGYRLAYEATHGPTDLTRRYTSTWPVELQLWLVDNHAKQYLAGLPSFARAYLISKMEGAAREGRLDEVGEGYFREFLMRRLMLGGVKSGFAAETATDRRSLQLT
jgi:hypothetical protein